LSKQEEKVKERRSKETGNKRYHLNKGTSNTLNNLVHLLGIPVERIKQFLTKKPD
jgi:DNA-directed RNA polymerase sigma subunit (sigma70/sigma32)